MTNLIVTNNDLGSVYLGDEQFEDEILTVAAAGTVAAGTLLSRDGEKLVPFVDVGTAVPVAVMGYALVDAEAGDIPVRPIIAGRVRTEKLVIGAGEPGAGMTKEVTDALRSSGIVALKVTELNILDNQAAPEPIVPPVPLA